MDSIFVRQASHFSSTVRPMKIGPIDWSYTSVNKYQHTQYNILEERMSELQGGRKLKSRIYFQLSRLLDQLLCKVVFTFLKSIITLIRPISL
jgi:hypothetical protein